MPTPQLFITRSLRSRRKGNVVHFSAKPKNEQPLLTRRSEASA
ncbi:MAG: hypothetical protein U5L45_22005 [Saprospiraceae bacterium]|nr:hypothetical protein [Saprospiraceae bacterium]